MLHSRSWRDYNLVEPNSMKVGGQQLREHNILDTIEEQITWSTAASTPQILIIDSFHKHSDEKHLEKQVLGAE